MDARLEALIDACTNALIDERIDARIDARIEAIIEARIDERIAAVQPAGMPPPVDAQRTAALATAFQVVRTLTASAVALQALMD